MMIGLWSRIRFVFAYGDGDDYKEFEFGYVVLRSDDSSDSYITDVYAIVDGALDFSDSYDKELTFREIVNIIKKQYDDYFKEIGLEFDNFI